MGRSDDVTLPLGTPFLTDPAAAAVVRAVSAGGHEVFFVGGCVRNALMGTGATDVDLATDAEPAQVIALAEAAGLRTVPTGLAHGTVTVLAEGQPFEVTTFRRDVETDGRRAVVAFAASMEEDARRRDFTINALYAGPDGHVRDPVGGLPDIAARRVRFIGDAAARIAEDRLRMLRFFRFSAHYADPSHSMDPDALSAIAQAAGDATALSAERIGAEMLKFLGAPDPAPALAAMAQTGLGAVILPGSDAVPMARLVHVEGLLGLSPDPLRRLAALAPEIGGLRLSKAQQKRHSLLRELVGRPDDTAALAYRFGAAAAWDTLALRAALLEAHLPSDAAARIAAGAGARFPLKASDLPLEGKALGDALKTAEARWIASGFTLDRASLIEQALNG
ncbi:MAG: CCA tRNA nucleotidyltransferase [Pseudomonadota bacterium]